MRVPNYVAALVLLWTVVFVAVLPMNPPSRAALLLKISKAESVATITREADPKNHRYVTYEYVVDGKTYSDVGYGPDGREMRLGDTVRVSYFPPYPKAATIATNKEQTGYLKGSVMAGFCMATFVIVAAYLRYFRTKGGSTPQPSS